MYEHVKTSSELSEMQQLHDYDETVIRRCAISKIQSSISRRVSLRVLD